MVKKNPKNQQILTKNDTSNGRENLSEALISVTAPAYNEEENLREFCARVKATLDPLTSNYEIVIVENGSADGSMDILRDLAAQDSRVKYVQLSRNFGHQGGLLAGMSHCAGTIIITMDADLQHPPEVLPELLECWQQGFDVVGTRKRPSDYTNPIRRMMNSFFYKFVGGSIGIPLSQHQSDFRLFDRSALQALLSLPEREKFLRGLTYWIGFRQTSVLFTPASRQSGQTKFNYITLISFAIHGLVSFTSLPLKIFSVVGSLIAFFALLNAGYIYVDWLLSTKNAPPPGWLTLVTGVYFLGGLQLIGIGVLGEYLAQNLVETRRRPSFIVMESTAKGYEPGSGS